MVHAEKPIAVYGAIVANFLIAVIKFIAGFVTGSSAMISEGIHSVSDTGNQLLLLLGIHRSKRPADPMHPYGHGKELYFWGLMVAVILFGLGGGMSVYEGITHLQHPTEIKDPTWNYVVLGIAFALETVAWGIAMKHFLKEKEPGTGFLQAFQKSKDPAIYVVIAEDSAALMGVVVAASGIYLGHQFHMPVFDGIASIVIGLILAAVAVFLAYETRGLLIGESLEKDIVKDIQQMVEADPDVEQAQAPLTMHFAPHEILLSMTIEFREQLSSTELMAAVERLESKIRNSHPDIKRIFIEASALQQGKNH